MGKIGQKIKIKTMSYILDYGKKRDFPNPVINFIGRNITAVVLFDE